MLGLKQAIDTYFNNEWNTTPIQFYGANFVNNTDRFIKLAVMPISSNTVTIDNSCKYEEMRIEVTCYGKNINECYELGDEVIQLIQGAKTFDVKSSITGRDFQLDEHLYAYQLSVTSFSNSVTQAVFPLVDGLDNLLLDGAGNQLVG